MAKNLKKVSKLILIGGYYGANNLGDEIILHNLLDFIHSMKQDIRPVVVSFSPALTKIIHRVDSVDWRDIPTIASLISESRLVVIGGGGLFMDYWGLDEKSLFRGARQGGITTYGSLALLSHAFGVPYVICGVGVGPLYSSTAQKHVAYIFNNAARVFLRDYNSFVALKETGLKEGLENIDIGADLAFALPERLEISSNSNIEEMLSLMGIERNKPLLGVSVRFWDIPHSPRSWIQPLAQSIREFSQIIDANIILIPFQVNSESVYTNDLEISYELFREIGLPDTTFVFERVPSIQEIQTLLSKCDLILGMRLHSIILGINGNVPVVAIAYDPKVQSIMKMAGLENLVCKFPLDQHQLLQRLLTAYEERKEILLKEREFSRRMQMLVLQMKEDCFSLDYRPLSPSYNNMKNFIIGRLRQIQEMDDEISVLLNKVKNLKEQLASERLRLQEIEASHTYRIARLLAKIKDTVKGLKI